MTTSLLAASLAFLPAAGIAAPAAIAPAANTVASRISIDNFGQVSATYFRGSQPSARDFADLAAAGVKMVIDLQEDGDPGEGRLVESAGMKFTRIAMNTRIAPTPEQITQFLKLVNDPANQPVYVHCAGGRHRTGVMTAVYRMTHDGWNSDQAFNEMKQFKFGADFLHPEFKKFVYAYRTEPKPAAPVLALTTPAVAN